MPFLNWPTDFKLRGSLRYGNSVPDSTFAMWPLAKLNVQDDFIGIDLPWRKLHFPRKAITRLMKCPGSVAIGLQIEHTLLEQPNLAVFWTYHFGEVKKALVEKNYTFVVARL